MNSRLKKSMVGAFLILAISHRSFAECETFLAGITVAEAAAKILSQNAATEIVPGRFPELEQLIIRAGYPEQDAWLWTKVFAVIREKSAGLKNNLPSFFKDFDESLATVANSVIIGVVKNGYRLCNGPACSLGFQPSFESVSLADPNFPTFKMYVDSLGLPQRYPSILLLNPSPEHSMNAEPAFALLHDLRHVLDHGFILKWVEANRSRRDRGLETDDLYKNFVRENEAGLPQVDYGFTTIFLESRAYELESEAWSLFVPAKEAANIVKSNAREAFDSVVRLGPVASPIAEKYPTLGPQNIFDLGQKIYLLMKETVEAN